MKETQRNNTDRLSHCRRFGFVSLALFLVLGVVALTSVSALAYRGILSLREETRGNRTVLSYIRSQVCAHDREGDVLLEDSGNRLVLREESGDAVYELRIYAYKGHLVEEYVLAGRETDPERATVIGETETFLAEWVDDRLLRVTTDKGELLLSLFAAGKEATA